MSVSEWLLVFGAPTFFVLLVQFIINYLINKKRKSNKKSTNLEKGVQALLRDRLRQEYLCYIKKGSLDISDKENYDNLYQSYHALGQNGVMDEMYKEVMALPSTHQNNSQN